MLVKRALADAKRLGHRAVLLVGDAPYFGRFGFSDNATAALRLPGPVERERFLSLELSSGALDGARGLVRATGRRVPKNLPAFITGFLPARQPMPHAA
jgi:predicted N-acetyltransferase YhbS